MDPNFSVLLGEENRDQCSDNNKEGRKNNSPFNNGALIGGLVGGIVGFVIIFVFLIFYVYPRFRLCHQTRFKRDRVDSCSPSVHSGERQIEIEKIDVMELDTVVGNFKVKF